MAQEFYFNSLVESAYVPEYIWGLAYINNKTDLINSGTVFEV